MRSETNPPQDRAAGIVPRAPWRLAAVSALADYRLQVRFIDGTKGVVDLSRIILGKRPGVFAALQDPSVFARVRIEYGAATWDGEIDIAPDAMYEVIKKDGVWTPD